MAWMSDEEYVYKQDCKEKGVTARSARHKRTHCGRGGAVRLPSDNMTKKELAAMNGECVSYRMNDPITYEEFKSWPKEHQETYIKLLRQKYNVPLSHISEMMGMERSLLSWYTKRYGLNISDSDKGHRNWDEKGFREWCEKGKEKAAKRDFDAEMKKMEDTLSEAFENVDIPHDIYSAESNAEIDRMVEEINEAWNETLGNYRPINEVLAENGIDICDNEYHRLPVIPRDGSMTFNNNYADDALAMIKSILSNVKVNLTISWECINE